MAGRPRGNRPSASERAQGYGQTGFCKLCVHPGAQFLNAAIIRRAETKPMNATEMQDYMALLDPDFKADRHTYYNHQKKHLTSPLITAAQRAQEEGPKILPKSNAEALEMVRNLGMKTAIEHPETIGVDHALRAISEMEKKAKGPEALWIAISRIQSGEQPELIMGEFKELTTSEEPQEAEVS